ncbi:cyclase family protein [Christensenellaceae bacterium OttesenSCG-928-K19]|nr:cyclase family protein [Christensenellaceae bacterium OttesenSCG-928-K19]
MLIDLTLPITPQMVEKAQANEKMALVGHLGTHFDTMGKEFPLSYTELTATVFDVTGIADRDISSSDIDLSKLKPGMFAAFHTGFIEKEGYGGKRYFTEHPQLSDALIDDLLLRQVAIIGVDFAGVRRGREHLPKDEYCANKNTFIVENLCNLSSVLGCSFTACTYPMNYVDVTGVPCRVIAKA